MNINPGRIFLGAVLSFCVLAPCRSHAQPNPAKPARAGRVSGASDLDLSKVYAFPVPFRAARDKEVTFALLPSEGKIRIYTTEGELVKEILFTNPVDGLAKWDVTNSDGQKCASDVYVYVIQSGDGKKTGKLIVIR